MKISRYIVFTLIFLLCFPVVALGNESTGEIAKDGVGTSENILAESDYLSNLPVVYINTADSEPITSKEKYILGTAYIQGNAKYEDQYSGDIKIKGRGNTSWEKYPKKPYKIKLDSGTDLFGMGKNKEWVLLPDYLDESLMRTRFCTNLADSLDMLHMDGQWVVLILNGEYQGVYELTEQVGIGSNRVDIFDWEDAAKDIAQAVCEANPSTLTEDDEDSMTEDMTENLSWMTSKKIQYQGVTYNIADYYPAHENLNEGYLFELSEEYDEVSKFKTSASRYKIMIKSPEYAAYNEEVMNHLKSVWNEWDEAIHSKDGYSSNGTYYADLMDLQSAVDYWLISEFSANGEAVKKSRYAYIGADGKITFGPVWDFDFSLDPAGKTITDWKWQSEIGDLNDPNGWKICTSENGQNFFDALVMHSDFINLAYERYNKYLKPAIASDIAKLDAYYLYLYDEGIKNTDKWKFDRGFEQDYKTLKKYTSERYAWMNRVFQSKESLAESLAISDK